MAKLSRDLSSGTLHPRENITGSGALGALNAEIVINADGASTVALDLRGTFNMTVEVAGSVDGTNWTLLAVRSISGGSYLAAQGPQGRPRVLPRLASSAPARPLLPHSALRR